MCRLKPRPGKPLTLYTQERKMKMTIKVIAKASTGTRVANICPWVMDVPPENRK